MIQYHLIPKSCLRSTDLDKRLIHSNVHILDWLSPSAIFCKLQCRLLVLLGQLNGTLPSCSHLPSTLIQNENFPFYHALAIVIIACLHCFSSFSFMDCMLYEVDYNFKWLYCTMRDDFHNSAITHQPSQWREDTTIHNQQDIIQI